VNDGTRLKVSDQSGQLKLVVHGSILGSEAGASAGSRGWGGSKATPCARQGVGDA